MITTEQFEQACADYKKAKALETQAEALRKAARLIILDFEKEHEDSFVTAPDSESGKTVQCGTSLGLTARITHPTSADKPSRFDVARTTEAYKVFEDALPLAGAYLFRLNPEFNEDGIGKFAQDYPGIAPTVASLLMPFSLPAEEGKALAPRVEVK